MDAAGVDRVMIDLERRGKSERQGSRDTWISKHTMGDIWPGGRTFPRQRCWSGLIRGAELQRQIDDVIARGADVVTSPMLRERNEAEAFLAAVDGGKSAVAVGNGLGHRGDLLTS